MIHKQTYEGLCGREELIAMNKGITGYISILTQIGNEDEDRTAIYLPKEAARKLAEWILKVVI